MTGTPVRRESPKGGGERPSVSFLALSLTNNEKRGTIPGTRRRSTEAFRKRVVSVRLYTGHHIKRPLGMSERCRGDFSQTGHGGAASLSRTRHAPQPSSISSACQRNFSGAKKDGCCFGARRPVTRATRQSATKYGSPGSAECLLRKTGRFAPKQCLGERHVGKVMLARFLDSATRDGISLWSLRSIGCA